MYTPLNFGSCLGDVVSYPLIFWWLSCHLGGGLWVLGGWVLFGYVLCVLVVLLVVVLFGFVCVGLSFGGMG